MEKSNIINLGERRQKREREKREKEIAQTAARGGIHLVPETRPEIAEGEALALANEVIEKYGDPAVLLEDYTRRENAEIRRLGHGMLTDEKMKKEMERDLASQRSVARHFKTEELLEIFASHKKNPARFYGTKILACAEELKRRFEPAAA